MSRPSNYLQTLVAHYLASQYPTVLHPFLEASRIPHPVLEHPPSPDLRTVVEDWMALQISDQLEKLRISECVDERENLERLLRIELPRGVELSPTERSLGSISASSLLTVTVSHVPKRVFDTSTASYKASYDLSIITSSVDKTLKVVDFDTGDVAMILQPHRAAILTFAVYPLNPRYILTGSMDGTVVLMDVISREVLQTFVSAKYVVRVAFSPNGRFMATASYDRHIVVYEAISSALPPPLDDHSIPLDATDDASLACEPLLRFAEAHRCKLDSNPEALLFHPNSTWLLYTTRSSHVLHYLSLPSDVTHPAPWVYTNKSFNPHPLDTHVSFAVLNMTLHPSGKIVACQTGDHSGGGGERLLLYGIEPEETERLACLWTGEEGDDYVLPRMEFLPDGSGIITTTSRGYLNLFTLKGEKRSSVKIHGVVNAGSASSEVIRDCAIISARGEGCHVVSVGYDCRVRFSKVD
ncbi:hypothetical protein L198_05008 [Cryptococcus wingfieldii CBS 7118]|uniref:Uncharacterized protein n=1 Tax=Cryptococcus wingfieldii CBS 7118 TaxID=1295528 RepID=A0A1E3J1V1_9TREE|nr:hypothetical protein L198_05008 [Cryptococcus wingfieldii CBS 7118]ODN94860.1 hypothetical protein L198_05008 [Cryptococcus wingfieldii CBS 7118]